MSPSSVSSRTLLASFLAGIFCVSTLYFFSKNVSLEKSNKVLSEQAGLFQEQIDHVREQAKIDIAGIENERDDLKAQIEHLASEQDSLKEALANAQRDADAALEEKTYLEDILIHKNRQLEASKDGASLAQTPSQTRIPAGTPDDLARSIRDKDEQIRKLTERNQTLSKKVQSLYKLADTKIAEISVAKIAMEETISQARKSLDNEFNAVDLGTVSVETSSAPVPLKPSVVQAAKAPAVSVAGKDSGRVLAINKDHGFVVVDLGKDDGIDKDTIFELVKNGKVIGALKVLEIRDAMTACNYQYLDQGVKLEINDLVSVRR